MSTNKLDREAFVQAVLEGKSSEECYWVAGGKKKDKAQAAREGRNLADRWSQEIKDGLLAKSQQSVIGIVNLLPLAEVELASILQDEKTSKRDKLSAIKQIKEFSDKVLPDKQEKTNIHIQEDSSLDELIKEIRSAGLLGKPIEGTLIEESSISGEHEDSTPQSEDQ